MLKGSTKKYLRSIAHHLNPVVMIGKQGLTESVIEKVNMALDNHELIKVKFIEFKEKKKVLSNEIAAKTGSDLIGMIGHIAIFYKQHIEEEKRKIKLPVAK